VNIARRLLLAPLLATPVAAVLALTPVPSTGVRAAPCRGAAPSDFNGDGVSDLAVGAPYDTVAGRTRAGAVGIRYGGRGGVPERGAVTWLSQRTPGSTETAERDDGFGAALAAGDFNGDRCGDLAVGVPDEVLAAPRPGADGNGAVQVFFGSPQGLRPGPVLTVRTLGRPYGTDRFGAALLATDLDHDRDDELVVGAPGLAGGGGIATLGTSGPGLREGRLITQRTGWVRQPAAQTDAFGAVLAAGDFDGDGRPEIAVGAPGDGERTEGAVTVLDPRSRTARSISQSGPALSGDPEIGDRFGAALAAGDFDADGRDDLAIGVPGEDLNEMKASAGLGEGAVHVLYGPSLSEHGEMWSGKSRRLRWDAGRYDHFGAALAAADLDGDGAADLAVGAPGRGAVQVLRGARGGLSGAGVEKITSTFGPTGQFGWALVAHRHGPGRASDLLVGVPGANGFRGAIAVVRATSSGGSAAWRGARGGVARDVLTWPGGGLTGFALS
jgi:FG-GAP repeat protein